MTTGGRRIGARLAVAVLLLALLAAGVASAAAGGGPGAPDPGFGKRGRVVVSLPSTKPASYFGRIAPPRAAASSSSTPAPWCSPKRA